MDERNLAELEMHIAAGTDLPTAFAALPDNRQPRRRSRDRSVVWIVVLVVVAMLLWLLLGWVS